MSRPVTKATKLASWASLAEHKSATDLLHYLMAFKASAVDNHDATHREEDRDGELACVRVQGFGLGRADGGLVLVTGWTETPAGVVGEHVVFAGYLTNMPDGGERYYTTPMGQALHSARVAAYAAQRAAQGAR